MASTLTVNTTIRMTPEQKAKLEELGKGNASAGFRVLYASAFATPKFVDGRTLAGKAQPKVREDEEHDYVVPTVRRTGYIGKK